MTSMTSMKTLFSFVFLLPCLCLGAQTSVLLGWDANTETNAMGYRLLAGLASRTYTITNTVQGRTTTSGIVSNLPSGKLFFALVAFDQAGIDSDFSNEVTWTNRLTAPKNFRLTGTMQAAASPTGPWSTLAKVDIPLPPAVDKQQFYRTRLLLEKLP